MQTSRQAHLMGTRIVLTLNGDQRIESLADQAIERLRAAEHRFSANDPTADLMQINAAAGHQPVVAAPDLYRLIKLALHYSCYPGGNLNVAIGPLVKRWHIGFQDARVPSAAEIQTALALTDPHQVELDDAAHTVFLRRPGMELDLGAVAKGFIGDELADWLRAQGIESALLNLGRSTIIAVGGNPDQPDGNWHVGIQDPTSPGTEYSRIVRLRDQALTTSGVAERQLRQNGRTYHHILNPRTGSPEETDLVSLTIKSPRGVTGELWTTMLFGKPLNQIKAVVAQMPDLSGLAITADGTRTEL